MKCFSYFKDKTRAREQKSAPILKTMSKSEVSEDTTRVTKSSCSVTSPSSMPEMYGHKVQNLRVFTFRELKQATNNFHRTLKIGEGGFGSVYKGAIKPAVGKGDPVTVAIKKLNTDGFQVLCFMFVICFCNVWIPEYAENCVCALERVDFDHLMA